ncbi:MAG: tRNA threonylcarbamoyladenosine dehydratase [Candidatus Izimaplasma bacterium HR2]|nr:MAG: tRNA threonylcarbamoyladenosine dehydratase [Candidatus Izimaplasma bacterium HR2]
MRFKRTIEQIGNTKFKLLSNSTVLVLGIGGVGGHACETLARSGIGELIIVDKSVVDLTNVNRQIIALSSTVGKPKVEVMKERLLDINPDLKITTYHEFYNLDTKSKILNHKLDFICDAIDTVTFKIDIIKEALSNNIPIISSMGMGNKLHPELIEISEISKTSYDPIAKVIRKKLRSLRINGKVPVVYSKEVPFKVDNEVSNPSSNSFVPATAGIIMASYIVNQIIE